LRGYTSELLAKAINQSALDTSLTPEEVRGLTGFLVLDGALTPDWSYKGSPYRGYATPPGARRQAGKVDAPFPLSDLVQSHLGDYFSLEYDFHQQMTMLQIVGGVDRLAKAFEERVGRRILYQAEVKEIRKSPEGVRIVYRLRPICASAPFPYLY
jgi:monoamine oxidase